MARRYAPGYLATADQGAHHPWTPPLVLQHLHSGTSRPSGGVHSNDIGRAAYQTAQRDGNGGFRQERPFTRAAERLELVVCCQKLVGVTRHTGRGRERQLPEAPDLQALAVP